ncbi:hypothetical protein HWC54_gp065 [Klebsiella phage Marfa]|uniref:Uncharacterized protein n=1 Tax=Klebsiella phage Marfa TaxID=2587809 RepID=A0A4Y5TSV1_9CAUD|nr:hypothetical protein HWC54_gp065 [Klebsiella phage Marfa]QDB71720.1 hypothetical protein CPT_Marfa_065 [Klebsiella phage Marfa]
MQVEVSNGFTQDLMIEVRGSTIFFRGRGPATECDTIAAKSNIGKVVNAVVALIPDICDFERNEIGRLVLRLI